MNLNKLSWGEDILKLKFYIEKWEVQKKIGFKNIKFECKLNNRKMKKVNEETNLNVVFDDTFRLM